MRTERSGTRFVVTCRGEMDVTTCELFFDAVLPGIRDTQPQVHRVLVLFGFTTFEPGLVWERTMSPWGRRH
ncbi:hypothetical protein SAMN05216188_108209 [Lentzea xinjiangensis]|uniref:Uncharacterized protein n=1 Tax=Lentzea xinjiangensis TaxID=402600 RepID=A0A1H9M280_9PSEU|nr:hypothetical protein [Lentzea xinjiangensis]SER17595.1 hypothetical protein SAMN05216188_108209 [Lentzea xinjiangensis]